MSAGRGCAVLIVISMLVAVPRAQDAAPAATKADPRIDRLKTEAAAAVDGMAVFTQQMVDQIFSYGELGFQEQETHRYLVDTLKKNGFSVEEGIAGIPTAFMATWGSGKPVIALGSDIDGIPQSSQKPGVAYHAPLIEAAGIEVARVVAVGTPYRTIIETAEASHVELIVMATAGRTGFSHLILGSIAERVVRTASCPVLTIRPHE